MLRVRRRHVGQKGRWRVSMIEVGCGRRWMGEGSVFVGLCGVVSMAGMLLC